MRKSVLEAMLAWWLVFVGAALLEVTLYIKHNAVSRARWRAFQAASRDFERQECVDKFRNATSRLYARVDCECRARGPPFAERGARATAIFLCALDAAALAAALVALATFALRVVRTKNTSQDRERESSTGAGPAGPRRASLPLGPTPGAAAPRSTTTTTPVTSPSTLESDDARARDGDDRDENQRRALRRHRPGRVWRGFRRRFSRATTKKKKKKTTSSGAIAARLGAASLACAAALVLTVELAPRGYASDVPVECSQSFDVMYVRDEHDGSIHGNSGLYNTWLPNSSETYRTFSQKWTSRIARRESTALVSLFVSLAATVFACVHERALNKTCVHRLTDKLPDVLHVGLGVLRACCDHVLTEDDDEEAQGFLAEDDDDDDDDDDASRGSFFFADAASAGAGLPGGDHPPPAPPRDAAASPAASSSKKPSGRDHRDTGAVEHHALRSGNGVDAAEVEMTPTISRASAASDSSKE